MDWRQVSLLLFVMLTGCAIVPSSRGPEVLLDDTFIARITIGTTTQQQVKDWLGNPQQILQEKGADGNQHTIWHYRYYRQGTYELIPWLREQLSKPTIFRTLDIRFSADGIVRDKSLRHKEVKDPDVIIIP